MKRLGELPTDLRLQTRTQGPPPSWFTPSSNFKFISNYGSYELGTSPIEIALNNRFTNEYLKEIPAVARKYTRIDPVSPFFRYDLATFGFGDLNLGTNVLLLGLIGALFYCIYKGKPKKLKKKK